jgi:hypothetical protein
MSRLAYLIAALVILAGGTYALWPAPSTQLTKLLTTPVPTAWSATVDTISQHVTPSEVAVTVAGKMTSYQPDSEKVGRLWATLGMVAVPTAKVIPQISEAQLVGYGVGATRQATADDGSAMVRWGGSGGQAYVWNGVTRQLLAVDPQVLPNLDAAAQPPIQASVLRYPPDLHRLTVDDLSLVAQDGEWQAELFRNRPDFAPRVSALLGVLGRTEITDLAGVSVFGLPLVGTVSIAALAGLTAPDGKLLTPPQPGRTVTVYDAGGVAVIAINGYPAQRTDAARLNELRVLFATFKRDVLIDLYSHIRKDDVLAVEFARDGKPWWSLRRREKPPVIGGFYWDVVWRGGRESAADDVVDRFADRLRSVPVRSPVRDSAALTKVPAGAVLVTVMSARPDGRPVQVAIGGGELRTATHAARLADDAALEHSLDPADFLDRRLTRRDPSRVSKLQRRFRDQTPPTAEVVARNENGTWARTYPQLGAGGPVTVDGAAVDRLVRALAAARMADVRLVAEAGRTDDSRAILAAPEFELDVRFAAVVGGQASNDETDLDLTAAQDWGLAMRRDGERWQVVDKDLGLHFTLDADTVEEFRRPFTAGQVFPIVASAVTSASITRETGKPAVTLVHGAGGWTVADGSEAAVAADAVAVRRWFRDLAAVQVPAGSALDARIPEPSPAETVALITCTLPSIGGDLQNPTEQLTLALLRPGPQGQPVHVWSNRGNSRFPRGRTVLPPTMLAELFPAASALRK